MSEKKPSSRSKTLFSTGNIVFFALCVIVFYFVVHNASELKTVKSLFNQIDGWWLTVAVISQLITYGCTALLYYFLTNKFKDRTPITFFDLFKMSIVIVFINQIVTAGGISGNGFLYSELNKREVSSKKAFFTIIMECISLYVALGSLLIIIPLIHLSIHHSLPHLFWIIILFGLILYGVLAGFMTVLTNQRVLRFFIKHLSRIAFLRRYLEDIEISPEGTFSEFGTKGPWGIFRKYPAQSAVVVLGQLGVFFADSLTIVALLHGLHVHFAYIDILLTLILTFVASALPISPGALLIYEGAMTFFFTSSGMPVATALIITLMFRVLSFWAPILLGLGLYKHVQTNKE
ncbi:MAG TPA: lysylphosphatidylglycerol synthase transmembrane domain-containing protein [Candidatus Paceibacterota bacterium]|jgi:uncharacterized protein (TIRG00374 family)|nr:lysylphosphatidylglycerol synthase transmembrane domain-containing protein [Candidatus Paceibacterota bacterium]